MKKMFLSSLSNKVIDRITDILPRKASEMNLAFIPTARDPYHITAPNDPEKDKLLSMGFQIKTVDVKFKSKDQLEKEFDNINLIFVAGGNTFYLMEKFVESGFPEIIKKLIDKDVIYVGSSAGSVVAGPDINIVKHLDDPSAAPNLSSTQGLGLVDFIILPHVDNDVYKDRVKKISKNLKKYDKIVIPLKDTEAIIVEGNTYKKVESRHS